MNLQTEWFLAAGGVLLVIVGVGFWLHWGAALAAAGGLLLASVEWDEL